MRGDSREVDELCELFKIIYDADVKVLLAAIPDEIPPPKRPAPSVPGPRPKSQIPVSTLNGPMPKKPIFNISFHKKRVP